MLQISVLAQPPLTGAPPANYIPGELLVKIQSGPALQSAITPHARIGAEVLRTFERVGWQHVRLPQDMAVPEGLVRYQQTAGILAVQPNHVRRLQTSPDDPLFSQQWGLERINAPNAWDLTTGRSNVVVAVLDSGFNYDHDDLRANLWRNPGEIPGNRIDDDGNGYVDDVYGIDARNHDSDPRDDGGHGTAVAGIIGAAGNNGKGVAGLNWSVQLMALKYSGADGFGYDADLVECFDYLIMMKLRGVNIRVTNNSYGGDENGPAIQDAMEAAGKLGILHVCAAGNSSTDLEVTPFFPASFDSPSIISVAATTPADTLADFSNFGRRHVHLAAPGTGIVTLAFDDPSLYKLDFQGTSAACPFVAGTVALLAAHDPNQSAAAIKAAILGTVDQVAVLENKVVSHGRLNVARALQRLVETNAPPLVLAALPSGNRTPANARVEITFSQPMDSASVEAALQFNPAISGAFEWAGDNRSVLFIPSQPLPPAMKWQAQLRGDAHGTAGRSLDGNSNRISDGAGKDDFLWTFKTAPAEDDFANAQIISGLSGKLTATNTNATRERGEPRHAGNRGGASVWFRWLAPTTASMTFTTRGSQFDTLLAIYTGPSLTTLTTGASGDDSETALTSSVNFRVEQGTHYFIAIDGKIFDDVNRDAPPMGAIALAWFAAPELSIRVLAELRVEISWPVLEGDFVLQVADGPASESNWTPLDVQPMVAGDLNTVNFEAASSSKFFRLRKRP